MPDSNDNSYINSSDYKTVEHKLKELNEIMEDLTNKSNASRKLRFAEVDVEAEREEGRFQPDELYIPCHIIDTNIRREQSAYIQYITQSPRAVICEDSLDPAIDLSLLERDLTKKIRYDGWQLETFANIDNFQANGYSIMELIMDINKEGELACEKIQFGDISFMSDCRDIQALEMTGRAYYFTKTRLLALCEGNKDPKDNFVREQVQKVVDSDSSASNNMQEEYTQKDRSLRRIIKYMFRINGTVNVAWACPSICDGWLREPRPLFIGRKKLLPITPPQQTAQPSSVLQPPQLNGQANSQPVPVPPSQDQLRLAMLSQGQTPPSDNQFETQYPYFLFPYLISENDTITHLKGRVFLDQDTQEAVSSLLSSTCTKARRSAGLYFSRNSDDPNDDILQKKNVFFRSGCIIDSKVQAFNLDAPDPAMFSAIQALVVANQNETSQVNFAVNNRKDSRKTAKEIEVANNQAQILSTVQVVLFSLALKAMYETMVDIIRSRVLSGLLKVNPSVLPLYLRKVIIKPSGDTDVIEKQQLVQTMMQAWAVIQNTPAASAFLSDLIEILFPVNAAKYLQAFQQAQQQAASKQAQQQQEITQVAATLGKGIVDLSKHTEYFSELGKLHAFPKIEMAATRIQELQEQLTHSQNGQGRMQ